MPHDLHSHTASDPAGERLRCGQCRADIQPTMRFCAECGARLAAVPCAGAPPPGPAGGERRFLTVLFCDVVGSTEIGARLDPEDMRDLLHAYMAGIRRAVARHGGHFAQSVGDGALAWFGWPRAHEDDARRAVRAGLAILDEVGRLERPDGHRLEVRIGLHAGFVVVEPDGAIFGDAPSIASRVQAAAEPGTVAITDAVRNLLGESCLSEACGRHMLEGLAEPIALHRVAGLANGGPLRRPRRPTPFVGRDAELGRLLLCWREAEMGQGRSVAITGEAGVGKSRLVQALRERIDPIACRWLEFGGSELQARTPFHPVAELLTRRLKLHRTLDTAQRVERLRAALARAGLPAYATLAPLTDLLGLPLPARYAPGPADPEKRRGALLDTLTRWLLSHAREMPTVLLAEDHQWLDPSTAELLERLGDRLAGTPLLIVATERPRAGRPGFRAKTVVPLAPLGEPAIRRIVGAILNGESTPALLDRLVRRIGGNPLFAEELAQLIVDRQGRTEEHEIPATLAGSLMGRLDALGPAKEVAQIGAVLGGSFSRDSLQEVGGLPPARLDHDLADLVGAGILARRRDGDGDGGGDYAFGHALLRDAAYEALLRSRRRELHLRAATSAGVAPHHGIAAHHWDRAGEPARAMTAWQEAGLAASTRGGFREAEESYARALASLERLAGSPERAVEELKLRHLLVAALQITRGYAAPETIAAEQRVRALIDGTGDASQRMVQTAMEWAALSSQGRFAESAALAGQVRALAERVGRPDALAHAAMIEMTARYRVGRLAEAERSFRRGRAFYGCEGFLGQPGSVAQTFGNAARNAWLLGLADTARERSRHALGAAERSGRPYDLAFAHYMAAILAVLMRAPADARRLAERAMALSDAHAFPQFSAISRIVAGRAIAELGAPARGLALIEDGIRRMEGTGSRVALTLYHAWAAEAAALEGRWPAARAAIERALAVNPEERFFRPESLRISGGIRQAQGDAAGALADLAAAAAAAQEMGARISRLRAWLAARRLGLDAAQVLATGEATALCKALVEGRDTPDLRDAASLLGARNSSCASRSCLDTA